jgi:hypothetical protein
MIKNRNPRQKAVKITVSIMREREREREREKQKPCQVDILSEQTINHSLLLQFYTYRPLYMYVL